MRVIAGRLRGRRLGTARGRGVRPTADRVREALFSILGDAVADARVLDLFAGTGALAIEALSRGAREATSVERDPGALAALRRNVEDLALDDKITVVAGDALDTCRRLAGEADAFDVVFCDPPYRDSLVPLGTGLIEAGWWTRVAVLEHAASVPAPLAPAGVVSDTRKYGDTALTFYWRS